MKTKKNIIVAFIALLVMSACSNFNELNTDPTRMQNANPGSFMAPILYNVGSYNWSRYNGFTFHLMQGVVTTGSTGGLGWYYVNDTAGDGMWNTYYRWLSNIKEMEKQATELDEPSYQAIAKTLNAWIYSILVDVFGDIPMTEANSSEEGILTPKFDTQLEVYQAILSELEEANTLYNTAEPLRYNGEESELLYAGDVSKWKKLTNSLRLRILLKALNISAIDAKSEIVKMLHNPKDYPLFESNEDAAEIGISGVFPEEPPMTRPQDFTSYKVLSEFFVDNLKRWNDPRLPVFATLTENNGQKEFRGWPSGYLNAPGYGASLPNQKIVKPPLFMTVMSYSELMFILSELSLKGIISGDPEEYYQKGVQASIERWGEEFPEDYFDNPETKFDGTLETIMMQKYYALFFCDLQQWFEYNRTGLPKVPRGEGVPEGNVMPHRLKYPAILQRNNQKNYTAAKEHMGGDDINIPLIWHQR